MHLSYGRYQVRFPVGADTKAFLDVGDLLTTSVSTGLSKDSVTILYNTRYKCKSNIATSYKRYTCWNWILIRSPIDGGSLFHTQNCAQNIAKRSIKNIPSFFLPCTILLSSYIPFLFHFLSSIHWTTFYALRPCMPFLLFSFICYTSSIEKSFHHSFLLLFFTTT